MTRNLPYLFHSIVIMVFVCFLYGVLCYAEQGESTRMNDLVSVEGTIAKFCKGEPAIRCFPKQEFIEFKTAQMKWEKTGQEKDWKNLTATIYALSKSRNLQSRVTISTEPQNGADVYYQTWTDRQDGIPPGRFEAPTVCHKDLYLGEYFIWVERNGKPTSNQNAIYRVVKDHHEWTIHE